MPLILKFSVLANLLFAKLSAPIIYARFILTSFFYPQQAKAEQEEEFISNTLMKKIQTLKKEKEILAMNYEQEEEYLTNDLSKKLLQVKLAISC